LGLQVHETRLYSFVPLLILIVAVVATNLGDLDRSCPNQEGERQPWYCVREMLVMRRLLPWPPNVGISNHRKHTRSWKMTG